MKKAFVLVLCVPLVMAAQKKSGVVYSEHPAYDVVTEFYRVWESGTEEDLRALYTEDAKIWYSGDTEPGNIDNQVQGVLWWQKNFDISFTNMDPAKPDIIQYKGDKGAWTLDWMIFTGINKESGDTVKLPLHTANYVNGDGKITMTVNYFDRETLGAQVQESFGVHRNGRVFDEHPYIEILKEVVASWEAGDADAMATHFADDCTFHRLGDGDGYRDKDLAFRKESWSAGIAGTSSRKMNVYGYPDAIYYQKGEGGWEILSWWNHTFVSAETGEEETVFLHLSHSFNNDGKITREVLWVD
jgi:ketosteroid isomerase-like protein